MIKRNKRVASIGVVMLLVVSIVAVGTVMAFDRNEVERTSSDSAVLHMDQVSDEYDHSGRYAQVMLDKTNLEHCRSKASITHEIQEHAIGYNNFGATDPDAGITCNPFIGIDSVNRSSQGPINTTSDDM